MNIDPIITKLNSKVAAIINLPKKEDSTIAKIAQAEIIDLVFVYEVNKEKEMTIIRSSSI